MVSDLMSYNGFVIMNSNNYKFVLYSYSSEKGQGYAVFACLVFGHVL